LLAFALNFIGIYDMFPINSNVNFLKSHSTEPGPTAPQRWGKTRLAKELCQKYECTSILGEWCHGDDLTPGALHLTDQPPSTFPEPLPDTYELVSYGW
jgi:hypothetical protein